MLINEIYKCTQGEGDLLGMPSVLVRTNTCNLRCQWGVNKCDTDYTSWTPEKGELLDPFLIVARVQKLVEGTGIRHVILSGGEPTIQKDFPELLQLLAARWHVTVETNGTGYFDIPLLKQHPRVLLSISPKLASSVPVGTEWAARHNALRLNYGTLGALLSDYHSYLKFVVANESDLAEVRTIHAGLVAAGHPPRQVWLMAEGRTAEEVRAKAPWVLDQCIQHGYRYSPRTHLDIFGPKRRT